MLTPPWRRRVAVPSPLSAATVLRLSVLLQAGVAPDAAWRHLARLGDAVAGRVVTRLDAGADVPAALAAEPSWGDVAVAWRIAQTVGAPLGVALRAIATALQDASRTRDEVRVALAEPAGTARLMAWLPLVAVGLGSVLGFDTLRTVTTNPLGVGCAVAGLLLVVGAARWNAALVRRAQPGRATPGIHADLLAVALSGGVSLDRAARLLADAGAGEEDQDTRDILMLSRTAGVPAVDLLRASADLARQTARADGRLCAARLSSRLLIPLGVCTLPAFLLLGVAPLLLSVLHTTPLTL